MISTVIVTTVTTVAASGLSIGLGIAAVSVLIAFLVTKELAGATHSTSLQLTSRFLSVGVIPMVMAFAVIVALKIVEVLA